MPRSATSSAKKYDTTKRSQIAPLKFLIFMQDTRNKLQVFLSLPVVFIINYLTQYRIILYGSIQIGQYRLVERKPKKSMFTASDVKAVGGISYRQLNDWDSKGALPTQRVGSSGWRKFDSRQLFVILICAEIRNKFGVSIEKLAWLPELYAPRRGQSFFSRRGDDEVRNGSPNSYRLKTAVRHG